ncbi:MAG TPA: transporter substrate-binding domain-containing protein [Xanthomonadaceae bacterium]|nr:transporter substrate-binding domain-containing protein [Xanthomonadaceae bacterium]
MGQCLNFFILFQVFVSVLLALFSVSSAGADVLDRVRKHGAVRCAAGWGTGFSGLDNAGRPAGFDVDFCRAVAAAVLGKADAVEVERIDTANKYQALARGEVDIAFGSATWTYSRDVAMGTRFVTPIFFDGQGFMVWSDSPITRLDQAKGAKVCVQKETTTAANLYDVSRARGLDFKVIESSPNNMGDRFVRRECDLSSADRSELAVQRATRVIDPKRWRILDEIVSREPMGPYIAQGDERWFNIVRWAIQVTQIADARGVDATNLAKIGEEADGELRRLAGKEAGFGQPLDLKDDWAYQVLTQVGNYGQIFERNLGAGSPLGLERGLNRPWQSGGLFMPPLLR